MANSREQVRAARAAKIAASQQKRAKMVGAVSHNKSATAQQAAPPTSIDAVIRPASLPSSGWVLLQPATDGLPEFPQTETPVRGCTGAVPLFDVSGTPHALTIGCAGSLLVADVSAWDLADWNAAAAEWNDAAAHAGRLMLNFDREAQQFKAGRGGRVYAAADQVVTSVSGSNVVTADSSSAATPMQFTIALRYVPPRSFDVPSTRRLTSAEGAAWSWMGLVRRRPATDPEGSTVRHVQKFGGVVRAAATATAQGAGLEHGRWYRLGYSDGNTFATEVPKEAYGAHQAVVRFMDPRGAMVVAADVPSELLRHAEEAAPNAPVSLEYALVGIIVVLCSMLALGMSLRRTGMRQTPLRIFQTPTTYLWFIGIAVGAFAMYVGLTPQPKVVSFSFSG